MKKEEIAILARQLAPGRHKQALSILKYDKKAALNYIRLCISGRFDRSPIAHAKEKYHKKRKVKS